MIVCREFRPLYGPFRKVVDRPYPSVCSRWCAKVYDFQVWVVEGKRSTKKTLPWEDYVWYRGSQHFVVSKQNIGIIFFPQQLNLTQLPVPWRVEFKEFKLQLWSSFQITRVPCMHTKCVNQHGLSNYSRKFVHDNLLLWLVSYAPRIGCTCQYGKRYNQNMVVNGTNDNFCLWVWDVCNQNDFLIHF